MKGQLRPGGLALVIKSKVTENIGRTVELIKCLGYMQAGEIFELDERSILINSNGVYWIVRPCEGTMKIHYRGRRLLIRLRTGRDRASDQTHADVPGVRRRTRPHQRRLWGLELAGPPYSGRDQVRRNTVRLPVLRARLGSDMGHVIGRVRMTRRPISAREPETTPAAQHARGCAAD